MFKTLLSLDSSSKKIKDLEMRLLQIEHDIKMLKINSTQEKDPSLKHFTLGE